MNEWLLFYNPSYSLNHLYDLLTTQVSSNAEVKKLDGNCIKIRIKNDNNNNIQQKMQDFVDQYGDMLTSHNSFVSFFFFFLYLFLFFGLFFCFFVLLLFVCVFVLFVLLFLFCFPL